MAASFREDRGCGVLDLRGAYTVEEARDALDRGLAAPSSARFAGLVVDVSTSEMVATRTSPHIMRAAQRLGIMGDRFSHRLGVVASTPQALGLMRMGAMHAEGAGLEVQVCDTYEAAVEWVVGGTPSDDTTPTHGWRPDHLCRNKGGYVMARELRTAVSNSLADTRQGTRLYYATRNDLPESTRSRMVALLNQQLADCIDLQTQCKQAHWNVKGATFIALHELFDRVNEDVEAYVDLIAERVVQLGGVAEGTAVVVAERSTMPEYPLLLSTGAAHVDALAGALASFGRSTRSCIEEVSELGDADSADILTEVSRGIDKWLWFLVAHEQGEEARP